MALVRAAALVLFASLRNRVRVQLRRVRQPRYLVATALGLLYWWWYFGSVLGLGRPRPVLPERWMGVAELAIAGLGLGSIALAWLFGGDRAALAFSEAEIQFLFPAPLARRQLLHYKLLRALAFGLVGAAFTALFLGRGLSGNRVLFALGSWVALSTLSFHGMGASLTRAALAEHGLAGLRRRLLTLAVLGAAAVVLVRSAAGVMPPGPVVLDAGYLLAWARAIDVSPLGLALWPVRAPIRLALARDVAAFLAALPGALLVLALHYAWVLSSAVQFEEASLEDAERRARAREARRGGGDRGTAFRPPRARPSPFRLAAHGRPEVALAWKGLVAMGRAFTVRHLVVVALACAAAVGTGVAGGGRGDVADLLGLFALLGWAGTLLVGPGLARADLRVDLPNLEQLRALPLSGARIVRGELLAPLAVLTAVQWLLLPFPAVLLHVDGRPVGPGARLALALAAAIAGPALSLAALVIQNAFVVLLPGWASTGPERVRGPEALGMRLIVGLGNLFALGVAVLPAALAGGLALLAGWPLLGIAAAPLAAVVAAAVIAGEAWVATGALGSVFDRMEPSDR